MNQITTYQTLKSPIQAEFKDKGSRFLAFAYPVQTAEQVKKHVDDLRQEHHKARHWCYAYRLGVDGNQFRANDDGEPSGSAGRPILGQIDSFELTDVLVVVVRYFGGVKLGTGGLVRAYSDAVSLVLPEVPRVRRQQLTVWALVVPHAQAGRLEAELRATTARTHIEIVGVDYGAEATLRVAAADDDTLLHTVASLTKGSVQPERIGASWIEVSDYTG